MTARVSVTQFPFHLTGDITIILHTANIVLFVSHNAITYVFNGIFLILMCYMVLYSVVSKIGLLFFLLIICATRNTSIIQHFRLC